MADEYIKREDAIKTIHDEWDEVCNYDGSGHELANEMENVIDRVAAADVAPVVRGRWIDMNAGNATCSVCKRRHKNVYDYDSSDSFCRSCGADMREVQDG